MRCPSTRSAGEESLLARHCPPDTNCGPWNPESRCNFRFCRIQVPSGAIFRPEHFRLARSNEHRYQSAVLALRNRSFTLKKLFHHLLVFLGCLHLAGGPYTMLQAYAWMGMLVTYSQDDGLVQAAKDTFSGDKPCGLCCKIAAARDQEKDEGDPLLPWSSSVSAKLLQEMIPSGEIRLLRPRFDVLWPPAFTPVSHSFGEVASAPPTPPPRFAAC